MIELTGRLWTCRSAAARLAGASTQRTSERLAAEADVRRTVSAVAGVGESLVWPGVVADGGCLRRCAGCSAFTSQVTAGYWRLEMSHGVAVLSLLAVA
jgi:hypothetical protein